MWEIEKNCDVIFSAELKVDSDGFYQVEVTYKHSIWDVWVRVDVEGEKGQNLVYMRALPVKGEVRFPLYLFKGKNTVKIARFASQNIAISEIKTVGKQPKIIPQITPCRDRFYLDNPKPRHISTYGFSGAPVAVKLGESEMPFTVPSDEVYRFGYYMEIEDPTSHHHLVFNPEALVKLGEGEHTLKIQFEDGSEVLYTLKVEKAPAPSELKVVFLDVDHGNSVLLCLPNGKTLLVDCGGREAAKTVIFPYLEEQGITPDYFLATHFHDDHIGCAEEVAERFGFKLPDEKETEKFITANKKDRAKFLSGYNYLNSTTLCRYDLLNDIWDLGDVQITVLNSRYDENGGLISSSADENTRSVSLLVRYKDFGYYHASDNYSAAQKHNMAHFDALGRGAELSCQVSLANHHFHGDFCSEMMERLNPEMVFVPANQAVYARSAFAYGYTNEFVLREFPQKRYKDTFISYSSGSVIVSVNSGEDWRYETYGK